MERNNEGAGAAAAELPAPTEIAGDLTLFQIEESVALLAESAEEEGLTPEIERALAAYLEGALEKRDRVAQFIHYCDGMAELAKAEIKRLQARQKHFVLGAARNGSIPGGVGRSRRSRCSALLPELKKQYPRRPVAAALRLPLAGTR